MECQKPERKRGHVSLRLPSLTVGFLTLYLRLNLDLHRSQNSQILVSQIKGSTTCLFLLPLALRPQSNFEFQGQLHFESSLAQAFDRCGYGRGITHRFIDGGADFFGQSLGLLVHLHTSMLSQYHLHFKRWSVRMHLPTKRDSHASWWRWSLIRRARMPATRTQDACAPKRALQQKVELRTVALIASPLD